jgi:hypothetical protein
MVKKPTSPSLEPLDAAGFFLSGTGTCAASSFLSIGRGRELTRRELGVRVTSRVINFASNIPGLLWVKLLRCSCMQYAHIFTEVNKAIIKYISQEKKFLSTLIKAIYMIMVVRI